MELIQQNIVVSSKDICGEAVEGLKITARNVNAPAAGGIVVPYQSKTFETDAEGNCQFSLLTYDDGVTSVRYEFVYYLNGEKVTFYSNLVYSDSPISFDILKNLSGVQTSPNEPLEAFNTLSEQINELFTVKEDAITPGTTSQYIRGDKSLGNFGGAVLAAALTGIIFTSSTVITASDSVLSAFGKVQAQISALVSGKEDISNKATDFSTVNHTKYPSVQAAKTYIDTAVANLVASSPAALDTLNELAAALGNDANFATTVNNAIAGRLIASNNLSDLSNIATARTNLGLGTAQSPTFAGLNLSGQFVHSVNGAASTPSILVSGTVFTGGTTTTTKPLFLIEPSGVTTSNNWNINGTLFGLNSISGFSGNLLDLKVNGSSKLSVNSSGNLVASGTINANSGLVSSQVNLTVSGNFFWTGRSRIYSDADGNIRLVNNAGTSFDRLQFGGTSASEPAIKKNGANLQIKLADDSNYTGLYANNIALFNLTTQIGYWSDTGIYTTSAGIKFSTSSSNMTTQDAGISRVSASTLKITNASTGFGNLQCGVLYLNDSTVKQVTYGANDSGGAGKKVLCIDN